MQIGDAARLLGSIGGHRLSAGPCMVGLRTVCRKTLPTLAVSMFALVSGPVLASLVLEPSAVKPSFSDGATVSPPLSNGFMPVVFRPSASKALATIKWRLGEPLAELPKALHWHMQNTMAWPVTINVTFMGADGESLRTQLSLPPGPPQTITIPMHATSPLAMGMRAPPPQPFYLSQEPVIVATTVSGKLKRAPDSVTLSMPSPDVDQTILVGKLFQRSDRDDLKRLYTDLLDCFGQFKRLDWPEKLKASCTETVPPGTASSVAHTDLAMPADTADFKTDAFGGLLLPEWPSDQLASGAFRTYRQPVKPGQAQGRWMLLTPKGNPFFSLGVNAIQLTNSETFIAGREFMFAALPDKRSPLTAFYGDRDSTEVLPADAGAQRGRGYGSGKTFDFYRANLFRKDGQRYPQRWQRRTEKRLQTWGFNTAGAWSDEAFTRQADLPYTAIIHIEGPFRRLSDGHNWWQGIPDPFDPAFKEALTRTFARVVPAHRHNDRLIGYFVDNELAWGDGAATDPVARFGPVLSALAMDGNEAGAFAKRAFIQHIKDRYGDVDDLAKAWQLPLSAWEQLEAPVKIERDALNASLTNRTALTADLSELLGIHAREYFSLVAQTLQSFDAKHLYLGSRFASRTPEAVAACVQYCDVVSFNLYVPTISSGFEEKSFASHDKPAMLTEFHFGSADRGPFWAGVMSVASEEERGPAYQRMVSSVLANDQFVGAHWFQYLDQTATGRWLDGENGHLGLVSITDTPWAEFTTSVTRTNRAALRQFAKQSR